MGAGSSQRGGTSTETCEKEPATEVLGQEHSAAATEVQRVPERSEGSWPTPGRARGPRRLGQRGKDPVTGFGRPAPGKSRGSVNTCKEK